MGTAVFDWPKLKILWDLDPGSQWWALDNATPKQFHIDYPNGLELVWVNTVDLNRDLVGLPFKTKKEMLATRLDKKTRKCIDNWIASKPLTPPYIILSGYKITPAGGIHRLQIARAEGETILPLLVEADQKNDIGEIIPFVEI